MENLTIKLNKKYGYCTIIEKDYWFWWHYTREEISYQIWLQDLLFGLCSSKPRPKFTLNKVNKLSRESINFNLVIDGIILCTIHVQI